jgi:hypothetical protein
MKRFTDLTPDEVLTATADQLTDAIRVEAIEQGIKPPVPLPEAIQLAAYQGHVSTKDDLTVYRLGTNGYHDDVGWLTEDEAIRAMQGAVVLESTYDKGRSGKRVAPESSVVIKRVVLPGEPQLYKIAKLEEYTNDDAEKYGELVDACTDKVREIRQAAYDLAVARTRKAEYMRLANNDEAIAKAFWAKAETLPWPDGQEGE